MFGRSGAARRQLEKHHLAPQAKARTELDGAEAERIVRVAGRDESGHDVVLRVAYKASMPDPREQLRQQVLDELQEAERDMACVEGHAQEAIAAAEQAKAQLVAADERRKECRRQLRRVAEGAI